jgi:protein-S-isoprenylcysteine O-methyltransferase Ste14
MHAKIIAGRIVNNFLMLAALGSLLYIAAGTVCIRGFWIYAITALVYQIISLSFLAARYPQYLDLANVRRRRAENAKPWDKALVTVLTAATLLMYLLTGLDIGCWHVSELPLVLAIPGVLMYVLGSAVNQWAMVHNRFFERNVRIQTDREHSVVTADPYRLIRHPGYLGSIIFFLSFPLLCGSAIGWLGSAFCVVGMVGRTYFEDRTLQAELSGYVEYCRSVRYRLIPHIW